VGQSFVIGLQSSGKIPLGNSGLIGFGRPAIPSVRNEARVPGNHCARVRVVCRIGWPKRISRPNCTLSFIIFLSAFNRRWLAVFFTISRLP
jgi:hypothetical protein